MAKVTWLVNGRHRGSAQGWKKRRKIERKKRKKKKGLNVSLKPVGVGGLIQRRARRAPEVWETGGLLPAPRAVWRCQGRNPAPGDWGSR